jgi:SAM-dependent methyltransferase
MRTPHTSPSTLERVDAAYGGMHVTQRLLRSMGWGPGLLNLGSFALCGPLVGLNLLLPNRQRMAGAQQRLVRNAVALLAPGAGERILEVACGRGQGSFYLAAAHPDSEVVGIDLLEANVAVARILFPGLRNLSYQMGDAEKLAFEAASFDGVLCLEAAFHFPDRRRFLTEVARVLKPGGRFVLVDFAWRTRDLAVLADERIQLVREVWGWEDFHSHDEYLADARAAGLRLVRALDWSRRVTQALQWISEGVVLLGRSRLGRSLLTAAHPEVRNLSRADWEEVARSTAAHRFVAAHSRYMAYVFAREGGA